MIETYRKIPIRPAVRWTVWERDNFTCHYCGTRRYLGVDHVVAESAGGDGTPSNFVTACRPCNSKKGVRSYDDFTDGHPRPVFQEPHRLDESGLPFAGVTVERDEDTGAPVLAQRVFWDATDYQLNINALDDQIDKLQIIAAGLRHECELRYG